MRDILEKYIKIATIFFAKRKLSTATPSWVQVPKTECQKYQNDSAEIFQTKISSAKNESNKNMMAPK